MKAYKVFNSDWTCRGFQYEVGKTYTHEGKEECCSAGFHACKKVSDCFSYYSFDPANKVAEVELSGVVLGEDQDKQCSSVITIMREVSWEEMLTLANTGVGNSGNMNSGNMNSGNGNSGMFNTTEPFIRLFNKDTSLTRDRLNVPSFLYFNLTQWVSHDTATEEEKAEHKQDIEACGGFLKTFTYKDAFKRAWVNASNEERQQVQNLPNFDADIFFEISGIRV